MTMNGLHESHHPIEFDILLPLVTRIYFVGAAKMLANLRCRCNDMGNLNCRKSEHCLFFQKRHSLVYELCYSKCRRD
jgi:hypothetical protein